RGRCRGRLLASREASWASLTRPRLKPGGSRVRQPLISRGKGTPPRGRSLRAAVRLHLPQAAKGGGRAAGGAPVHGWVPPCSPQPSRRERRPHGEKGGAWPAAQHVVVPDASASSSHATSLPSRPAVSRRERVNWPCGHWLRCWLTAVPRRPPGCISRTS